MFTKLLNLEIQLVPAIENLSQLQDPAIVHFPKIQIFLMLSQGLNAKNSKSSYLYDVFPQVDFLSFSCFNEFIGLFHSFRYPQRQANSLKTYSFLRSNFFVLC